MVKKIQPMFFLLVFPKSATSVVAQVPQYLYFRLSIAHAQQPFKFLLLSRYWSAEGKAKQFRDLRHCE